MKSLTPAEALVLTSLAGAKVEPDASRERWTALPRATYQQAKRRLYRSGLIEDHYIPHPAVVGVKSVRFIVARPFVENIAQVSLNWAADPSAVHVQTGATSVLGVFFRSSTELNDGPRAAPTEQATRALVDLSLDPFDYCQPVYFDYEGELTMWAGTNRVQSYPRALGGPWKHRIPPMRSYGALQMHDSIARLIAWPTAAGRAGVPPHRRGPAGLPRSVRRWIVGGQVQWRPTPNLAALPFFRGRAFRTQCLFTGKLRAGVSTPQMFHAIIDGSEVRPFLLVTDGVKLLLGVVWTEVSTKPDSKSVVERDSSLQSVLSSYLTNIDVARENLGDLRLLLDHRYDRMLRVSRGPANPVER